MRLVCRSVRRKALKSSQVTSLNFRVQGLHRQRHPGESPLLAQDLSRTQLRQKLRQRRRRLSAGQQAMAATALYRRLAQHPLFRRARHIAFYLPSNGEIDPRWLMQAAQRQGKALYLPVLTPPPHPGMCFQRLLPGESLTLNRFHIAEPRFCQSRQRPVALLDLILLPLVGFDAQGGRLGMGGGFYDRALASVQFRRRPWLVGVAHECQKVDHLPLQTWDVKLQATFTDQGCYPALPQ